MHENNLPVSSANPATRAALRRSPAARSARILLAEDDTELRQMIASALRADGFDVVESRDGGRLLVEIGSTYLHEHPSQAFDLLISDVRMPICGGLMILEGLRQAHWPTPAIVMSAFGDEAMRDRASSLGAAYFDKPFDLDDLRTAAVYMIQRKRPPVVSGSARIPR